MKVKNQDEFTVENIEKVRKKIYTPRVREQLIKEMEDIAKELRMEMK